MAPIGLKAVVGESKWRPGAARGPAKPVIQAPPSREGSPSGFLQPADFPDSRFTQIPSSPRSSSPQTPPQSLFLHLLFIPSLLLTPRLHKHSIFLFTFIPSPPSRHLSSFIPSRLLSRSPCSPQTPSLPPPPSPLPPPARHPPLQHHPFAPQLFPRRIPFLPSPFLAFCIFRAPNSAPPPFFSVSNPSLFPTLARES